VPPSIGKVPDFPTDKGIRLDGTVGRLSDRGETAAFETADISQIQVFVSGAGVSDPRAMGLEEDLRLLVQAFIRGSRSCDRETATDALASDVHADIKIALHGLTLAPEEEHQLHHLIRELVRKRAAGKGATK
jgi:hypothetical protein